jgi:hypothetical protein
MGNYWAGRIGHEGREGVGGARGQSSLRRLRNDRQCGPLSLFRWGISSPVTLCILESWRSGKGLADHVHTFIKCTSLQNFYISTLILNSSTITRPNKLKLKIVLLHTIFYIIYSFADVVVACARARRVKLMILPLARTPH